MRQSRSTLQSHGQPHPRQLREQLRMRRIREIGATRVTLDPGRGGTIRELNWHGHDVLRPTPANAGDDPLDTACFPMVPFVNRIAYGRFEFGGRTVQLERNWSEDPHPLHGQGWRKPWTV